MHPKSGSERVPRFMQDTKSSIGKRSISPVSRDAAITHSRSKSPDDQAGAPAERNQVVRERRRSPQALPHEVQSTSSRAQEAPHNSGNRSASLPAARDRSNPLPQQQSSSSHALENIKFPYKIAGILSDEIEEVNGCFIQQSGSRPRYKDYDSSVQISGLINKITSTELAISNIIPCIENSK